MTKQEKIIVSAYTGVLMCRFAEYHEYIESVLGRPVLTHELAMHEIQKEIQEKTKDDFLRLCKQEDCGWISVEDKLPPLNTDVIVSVINKCDNSLSVLSDVIYNGAGWEWAYEAGSGYYTEMTDERVTHWMYYPEPAEQKEGRT